jgi:hypothetical protein
MGAINRAMVREADITGLLGNFAGYGYDLNDPRYPYKLWDRFPDKLLATPDAKRNNCSTFTEALLVKAWQNALGPEWKDGAGNIVTWDGKKHMDWMVRANMPDKRFSPIDVAVDSGMASEPLVVERNRKDHEHILPSPWSFVQGFRHPESHNDWERGHNFIIVDMHRETGRVLTLESNNTYRMNGPGFRMLGNIDQFDNYAPPKEWWKDEELWTWNDIKNAYPFLKIARLHVSDTQWAR